METTVSEPFLLSQRSKELTGTARKVSHQGHPEEGELWRPRVDRAAVDEWTSGNGVRGTQHCCDSLRVTA